MTPLDVATLRKAASDNGFGFEGGKGEGGLYFDGVVPARLWLSRIEDGPYLAATDHAGAVRELTVQRSAHPAPEGFAAFEAGDRIALERLVRSIFRLAKSLPDQPLDAYRKAAEQAGLTDGTEAVREQKVRLKQHVFRNALMDYWDERCAVTGLVQPRLLRASHTRRWEDCTSDAERLDVHNGLLLAAHLDAAFDAFLISFDPAGRILFAPDFSDADRERLGVYASMQLRRISPGHERYLNEHRERTLSRSGA